MRISDLKSQFQVLGLETMGASERPQTEPGEWYVREPEFVTLYEEVKALAEAEMARTEPGLGEWFQNQECYNITKGQVDVDPAGWSAPPMNMESAAKSWSKLEALTLTLIIVIVIVTVTITVTVTVTLTSHTLTLTQSVPLTLTLISGENR